MEKVLTVLIMAFIVESVWETLKMVWQEGKVSIDKIGALITSLVVCIGVDINLLSVVGITEEIPFLGVILTGILMSRGSNFIHDFFEKIGQVKGEK